MYTLSTCPWCRKTKKFFKDMNVDFDYIDYDLADEATQKRIMDDMGRFGGSLSFPFVKVDGKFVQGYNPEKFKELLAGK
jgi:glutaredoxin